MATRGVPQPGDVCALIAIAVQEVESGALVMSDSCVRWCGKVRASLIIQVLIYKQFDLFLRRLYLCPSPVSRLRLLFCAHGTPSIHTPSGRGFPDDPDD